MSYGPTQERVGHLRGVSKNSVAKTGRDAGLVGPASGKTEHRKSTNDTSRSGSEPGREIERGFGPRSGNKAGVDASRIDDKISGV